MDNETKQLLAVMLQALAALKEELTRVSTSVSNPVDQASVLASRENLKKIERLIAEANGRLEVVSL